MKIISFSKRRQVDIIERILKYCGLWKEKIPRPPPEKAAFTAIKADPYYDYTFFDPA